MGSCAAALAAVKVAQCPKDSAKGLVGWKVRIQRYSRQRVHLDPTSEQLPPLGLGLVHTCGGGAETHPDDSPAG
jgi:hypothetical protein